MDAVVVGGHARGGATAVDVTEAQRLAARAAAELEAISARLRRAGVDVAPPPLPLRAAVALRVLRMSPAEAHWRTAIAERELRSILDSAGAVLRLKQPSQGPPAQLAALVATLRVVHATPTPADAAAPVVATGGLGTGSHRPASDAAAAALVARVENAGESEALQRYERDVDVLPHRPQHGPRYQHPQGYDGLTAAAASTAAALAFDDGLDGAGSLMPPLDAADAMPYLLDGELAELQLSPRGDAGDEWVDCTIHLAPTHQRDADWAASEGLLNTRRRATNIFGTSLNAACTDALTQRGGDPHSYTVHVLPTRRFDHADGHSGRLVRGIPPHRVRRKRSTRIVVGGSYESIDALKRWWSVTVKGENVDGTYAVFVHDGTFKNFWPAVHASNIRSTRYPHYEASERLSERGGTVTPPGGMLPVHYEHPHPDHGSPCEEAIVSPVAVPTATPSRCVEEVLPGGPDHGVGPLDDVDLDLLDAPPPYASPRVETPPPGMPDTCSVGSL